MKKIFDELDQFEKKYVSAESLSEDDLQNTYGGAIVLYGIGSSGDSGKSLWDTIVDYFTKPAG